MTPITPEIQAKIDRVTAIGRAIYSAIVTTKPPTSLGLAARNEIPYEKLPDDDVLALAKIGAACVKAGFLIQVAPAPVLPLGEQSGKDAPNRNGRDKKTAAGKPEVITPEVIPPAT